MNRCEIDPNLLLFIDPAAVRSEEKWLFFEGCPKDILQLLMEGSNVICHFPRRRLLHQFKVAAALWLKGVAASRVLFINDGLLSCFLHARSKKAYRLYLRRYLPKTMSLRLRMVYRLPLLLRCESTFLVLLCNKGSSYSGDADQALVEATELMLFSNRLGKLLLLDARNITSEHGEIMKTTAHCGYLPVMEKEFATLSDISAKMTDCRSLPQLGRHFVLNGRHFFTEKYIFGESLRHVLQRYGTHREPAKACYVLHLLDQWYASYLDVFTGSPRPFSTLTTHLLPLFSACYPSGSPELVEVARRHLADLDCCLPGLVPVVSHNDLWPGNFLSTRQGLVVLDWERATPERAPFFDYFWMIISAVLEYLAGAKSLRRYSNKMDIFLEAEDEVALEGHRLLRLFLKRLGVPDQHFQALLFLFLMEGSVQGFQSLGRQTEMDAEIFSQLLKFTDREAADGTRYIRQGADEPEQEDELGK
ncbi:MAG: hypothetical protein ACD_55C00073G0002 [uncultured bacterium]|uniref:Aminoglycoside phosphotransferase domain-containing protein n=1 Tax=Citrifermentans bemidjiense (strain ATCC BAA-1014 / DSM 16622 / JCM 12645 / Bem) TaxID=404380 RepID=B5EA99_CITBB|nr:phosphotransferase [Citrifermentans bemidjiense]ACH38805.1 hypothetical protein Gbem_1789 [Citrifermentans bemidjiense Bem]EKD59322.1 MAG: hypothetical protein ACD_55C00073G0002 [uncultured bacterium]